MRKVSVQAKAKMDPKVDKVKSTVEKLMKELDSLEGDLDKMMAGKQKDLNSSGLTEEEIDILFNENTILDTYKGQVNASKFNLKNAIKDHELLKERF